MLRPTVDGGLDAGLIEVLTDDRDDFLELSLPLRGLLGHHVDDLVVELGIEGGEAQVLQFPLDRIHAKAMSQWREDLEGLLGDAVLLVRPQESQGPHVVQPIGELDDQHSDVAAHRDDHLADGLGLRRLPVLDLVEFRHPVDEQGHFLAEVCC